MNAVYLYAYNFTLFFLFLSSFFFFFFFVGGGGQQHTARQLWGWVQMSNSQWPEENIFH